MPGEGKTTTVANLAVVLAEAGRRVLVLSMDFRSPRIHQYFKVNNRQGVAEVLNSSASLTEVVQDLEVPGVFLATHGKHLEHPGSLLVGVQSLLDSAAAMADVVLIDTPPLLACSDAVDLMPYVDAALLVCRVGRTRSAQTAAAQRLLDRVGAPILGTVLVGTRDGALMEGRYPAGVRPHGRHDRRAEHV